MENFTEREEAYKKSTARLFIIVGNTPNKNTNGKDLIIQAVDSMGSLHASVIRKYTSRGKKEDDGNEIICDCKFVESDGHFNQVKTNDGIFHPVDIVYRRNGNLYGLYSKDIWNGLKRGKFQVVVISDVDPINQIRKIFGGLVLLVYVHSHNYGPSKKVDPEFELFSKNFTLFNHVLIYEDNAEELYDQLFRLFRAYEKNLLK